MSSELLEHSPGPRQLLTMNMTLSETQCDCDAQRSSLGLGDVDTPQRHPQKVVWPSKTRK